jgi:hypothetical protein
MPFDLTNALNLFIIMMNYVLHVFIGAFSIIYFNDILVYNESLEQHMNHLCYVLYVLRNEKLYAKLKKCTFCMVKVVFLGYVVSEKGIEMVRKLYERQIKKKNE